MSDTMQIDTPGKERQARIVRTVNKIIFALPVIPSLLIWPPVLLLSRAYMPTRAIPAILLLIGVMGYALAYTLSLLISNNLYENMRYTASMLVGFVPMAFIIFSLLGYILLLK